MDCIDLYIQLFSTLVLINYEISTVLAVDLMATYPLSVSVTGRYFFLSILIELSAGYGIPLLKDRGYHTYLSIPTPSNTSTVSICSHNAFPPQDSDRGHPRPQLTFNEPNTPNQYGPLPNICNRRRSWPIIFSRRHSSLTQYGDQSQPT